MRITLLCLLLGLAACQKTTDASSLSGKMGGTSSGGPAAVVDLVHCHSGGMFVDIALGQGRRLLLGDWQEATDPVGFLNVTAGTSLSESGFYTDQLLSSTQLEMTNSVDAAIRILLNTAGLINGPPGKEIPAVLMDHGVNQQLACTLYPDGFWWPTNVTTSCPNGWHIIESYADGKLCILNENLWPGS